MNIKSLISVNNSKSTNPLNKKNSKPSFSGCVLTQDSKGNDVYKINAPNAPGNSKVQVALMTKDKNGEYKANGRVQTYDLPQGFEPLVLTSDDITLDENSVLGYKISINGKELKDNSIVGDKGFTIASSSQNANINLPKVIDHIFIDSFNVKNPIYLKTKRNHFNLLGGTINSVAEKVPQLSEEGFTDVLGNPVSGQDNNSSHGYWTTNPYQITKNLGNLKDFKNLMVTLYQNQMKWIADGAFVNEGIEGIHILDIMNHGANSPFLHYFETKDLNNLTAKFGVFSKDEKVNKHLHLQLMNAPYKIKFEKQGDRYVEKEIKRVSYDSTKPTYVQLFDDRLATEAQMNGNEVFNVYGKKTSGDDFEIAGYMASAQAYHAKVSPREVEDNYKKYKEAKQADKDVEFKNSLTRWKNFEFVASNKDGGVSLWVGNSDISKKQFVLPEQNILEKIEDEKTKNLIKAAPFQVQDDTVQVGKFWTNEVARTLTEETARDLAAKVDAGKDYDTAVKELIAEKKIPKAASVILQEEDYDLYTPLENILRFEDGERQYKLKPLKMPVSLTDGMMSYPFEAIEFSPDLVSVLAYPFIKNLAVDNDTVGLSRYEMYKMGDDYYNKMPERYRELYKKMDSVIASDMKNQAKSIMGQLGRKLGIEVFDSKDNLTQEGKEIYAIIAPDIAKFLIVSALAPDIKPKDNDKMLEYDPAELEKVSLNSLGLQYEVSPEDVAKKVIGKIQKGVDAVDENKKANFVNHLYKRLQNVDSDAINVARLIVERTESGLNWRIDAAKDVGVPDAVGDGKFDEDKMNKPAIYAFWNKFNTGVHQYNPHSYKIGELTDWKTGYYPKFKEKTRFDAITDYDYAYTLLQELYGTDDKGNSKSDLANSFQEQLFTNPNSGGHLAFFDSGILESINYAHRFVGNHDKPRILHIFALNMSQFAVNKAQAMSTVLHKGFENSSQYNSLDNKFKKLISDSIQLLESGKYVRNGVQKTFATDNFGVRPIDFNIDEVIEQAKEKDSDFQKFAENNPDKINKLKAQALQIILEPAMEKYRAVWFAMNALPGAPTNFAGDDLGSTGWETKCKNEKQENRNALRWDRLNDPDYEFLSKYKQKIDSITKIRKKEAASALANGATIKLENQHVENGNAALTLYRYNDKTDAVCIIHNNGFGADVNAKGREVHIDSINLTGLPNGLQKGTIYCDALNPKNRFMVTDSYKIERIDDKNKVQKGINLGNAGLILLREKDFKGKSLSFKGRIENANVKLANTKYNVGAPSYSKI